MSPPFKEADRRGGLFPTERASRLVLNDPRLEKIPFFLEVGHLAHPGEGIARARKHRLHSDLLAAAIGDVAQVLLEHRRIEPEDAARHGVLGVPIFELYSLAYQTLYPLAEFRRPELRVFHLDLINQVDAEIAMHRLVTQDVLILLCGAGHLVLPPQRQNLGETDVEEQSLHHAGEYDEAAQQLLVGLKRAGPKGRVGQDVDERDEKLVLVPDARDLVVGVEDLAFVQAQALDDVLVSVGMYGLFERLAQEILATLRRGDVAVGTQDDIVRRKRVRRDEETQVALDQAPLVVGQAIRILPQGDVAAHV